jgi:hypothetical protein
MIRPLPFSASCQHQSGASANRPACTTNGNINTLFRRPQRKSTSENKSSTKPPSDRKSQMVISVTICSARAFAPPPPRRTLLKHREVDDAPNDQNPIGQIAQGFEDGKEGDGKPHL